LRINNARVILIMYNAQVRVFYEVVNSDGRGNKRLYMTGTLGKKTFLVFLALCLVTIFLFVFISSEKEIFSADATIVSNTTGTVTQDGEVDSYSVSAIESGASATLMAYYKDYGTGATTRVANAYVTRTINIAIDNEDIIAAAANGRMKAKVLLSGTNDFTLTSGTQNISTSMIYALSGGIASSSVNLASYPTFTDTSISTGFLTLTPSAGTLNIVLTATAVHHAETPGEGTSEVSAETSLECTLTSVKILFSFDDVELTLTVVGAGKITEDVNSVETDYTTSQSLSYTFGEAVSLTALGNENSTYFRGWTVAGTPLNMLTATLPAVHDIPYNVNLAYTATFSNFDVASNLSSFAHNAQLQGPKATETNMTSFKNYHNYEGTNSLGVSFGPSTTKPSDAGTYTYTYKSYFNVGGENGDQIGEFTKIFAIVRDKPSLTPNQIVPYELYLGDALGDLTFSVTALHSITNTPIAGTWAFIEEPGTELVGGQQVITVATATAAALRDSSDLLNVTSGEDLYYRFTPGVSFELNSSISWGKVTLVVEDAISDDSTNIDGTERIVSITKTIVTSVDTGVLNNMGASTISKEAVKISLRATFNDSTGRYFFIGWRFGENEGEGEYTYEYLTAGGTTFDPVNNGLAYDYYLPEWAAASKTTRDPLTTGSVQAIFIEDTSADIGGNTLTKKYTGSSIVFSPTFEPNNNSEYGFNWTSAEYYVGSSWVTSAPSAMGTYQVRYNLRNADPSVGTYPVVGQRNLSLIISSTQILTERKTAGTYNQTIGWGTTLKYQLTSQGTVSGAVTNYYYSTNYDPGTPTSSTWTLINLVPAASSGCSVTYDLPMPTPEPGNLGGSSALNYTFMAVGPGGSTVNYGGTDYALVSLSQTIMCKIDSYVPSISNVEVGQYVDETWVAYGGAPTNDPVYFRATINYGGSGAQMNILNQGKTLLFNSYVPNSGFNPSSDPTIHTSQVVEFMLNLEYSGNVYIQIRNGVNKTAIYKQGEPLADYPIPVHLDFSAPTISFYSSSFQANLNGWDDEEASIMYSVVDSGTSPSGVELGGFTANNGAVVTPNPEGTLYSRICEIVIPDNKAYLFSVTDRAGNTATMEIMLLIDAEEVSLSIDPSGYTTGTWHNGIATVIAEVSSGPSGIKYEYKTSSGSYVLWDPMYSFISPEYDELEETYISENSFSIDPGSTGIYDTYTIKITNMAGTYIEQQFDVRLDIFDPAISLITDLAPYQGSTWTTSAVNVRFDVSDIAHTFNSGIDRVLIDDGSGDILLTQIEGQPLSYQFSVVKCTEHVISIFDLAGNEKVYSFTLKVDLGTPDIFGVLYVGGGNPSIPTEEPDLEDNYSDKLYDYEDIYFYVTENHPEPWIRVEFYITATASGTILQQSVNKTTWVTVSSSMVPEGSATEQEFYLRLFYTSEQNTPYHYRLVTGGNRFTYMTAEGSSEVGPPQSFQMKIDKTAPVLSQNFIVDRVQKDITTLWTTENATWKFSLIEDQVIGSGLKMDSIKLYSWPYTVEDTAIETQFAGDPEDFEGTELTLPIPVLREYTYELTVDSLKYAVYAEDNAGHKSLTIVFPQIDFTSNIYISGITPSITKLNGDSSLNEYSSSFWVPEDERVNFAIATLFDTGVGLGRNYFGPSGGGVQFSVDGGATWVTSLSIEGVNQPISLVSLGQYSLQASAPQYFEYTFRAFTGAGYFDDFETSYWVKKDNVSPSVELSAIYSAGVIIDEPYTGQWIDGIVEINIEAELGPSLGGVYYATTPLAGGEMSPWTLIKQLSRADVIYDSENSTYIYTGLIDIRVTKYASYVVKVVTRRDPVTQGVYIEDVSSGIDVRIDRDSINIEARGYKVVSETELLSGDWSDENINLRTYVISKGPSAITGVYVSSYSGTDWSEYTFVGNNISAAYLISDENYLTGQYRLRVVNETGKTAVSPIYNGNIDKYIPAFTMSIGTSPLASGIYAGWYIQNVEILVEPSLHPEYGIDGYVASYYYREHLIGEWQGPVDAASFDFFLMAQGIVGGYDYDYRFTVRGRSGIEAVYQDEYIPIDTTAYTYTINMFVGDVPDPKTLGTPVFASAVNGVSMTYSRGANPEVGFVCSDSYRIKSVEENFNGVSSYLVENQSFASNITSYNKNYDTGLSHVVWTVQLYKSVEIDYTYTKQYKQNGAVVSLGYAPTDTSFGGIFGEMNHLGTILENQIGIDILYTPDGGLASSVIPQEMGVYDVSVDIRDITKDIYIVNPNLTLTVVYFAGEGTYESPYSVSMQSDFEMISQYMYYEEGYEIEDPLEYLGTNRIEAYFIQSNNFTVSRDMNPICSCGEDFIQDFMGNYNGNGYEISINDTVNVNAHYGLFGCVSGTVENLGVRMNLKINSTLEDKMVGMIASRLKDGTIKNSYAIGSVTLTGEGVYFGGLVGYADNSLVAQSFVDVNIIATAAQGMIGGAVGRLINNSFCEAIYSSGIIKILESTPYSISLPLSEVLCFGNIAGYSGVLEGGISPERQSLYITNNLAVDGLILGNLPMSNISSFMGLMMNPVTGFYFLEGAEDIIEIEGREKSLGDLMSSVRTAKAASLAVTGLGESESPFIIDSPAKFAMIERLPWAFFEQYGNITFFDDDRSNYCYDMPFTGVYDGMNGEIRNINFSAEDITYSGLFSVLKGTVKNLRLVGVDIIARSTGSIFVGALSGYMLEGSLADKIVISGSVESDSSETVFTGALVGLVSNATVSNCVSLASVNVRQSKRSIAGGLIGQVQGISDISSLVGVSNVINNFTLAGTTGRIVANIISSGTTVTNMYSVSGSAYSNGKLISGLNVTYSVPSINGNFVASYDTIAGASSTVQIGDSLVKDLISGLYPFSEGNGTTLSPFRIHNYSDLLEIGNYMYANFVLADNIVIGDYNDDGQLTSADEYKYDYEPIGGGAAFTGYLDGTSTEVIQGSPTLVKHYIIGLTDSLFHINAGRVANIGLSLNYKVYATEEDIPENEKFIISGETYTPSKVAPSGRDIYFGGVAKYNRHTANLRNVTVEGLISIRLPGTQKAVVGALVGADYGGNIIANTVEISMDIRSFVAEVGGIAGSTQSIDNALTYMNTQIVEGDIRVTASSVAAGFLIGAIKVETSKPLPNIIPQCDLYIDNVLQQSPSPYGIQF